MSETSKLTGPIVKALEQAGYFALRLNSGSAKRGKYWLKLCPEGTADILCCPRDSMPLWIETKDVKKDFHKKTAEAQENFRNTVESLGHKYIVARSLDDVLNALRG